MRVLFSTNHFWNYTGSELNLIGLARATAARGHEVACCALFVTPTMREALQRAGLRLLPPDDGALAEYAPEAVFCQHHSAAAMVRGRLPVTPMVLAHLGVEPELEQGPLVSCGAGLHLAISEEVRDALISQNVPAEKIRIFRNAIDTSIHTIPRDGGERRQAILFSYKLSQEASALIASVAHALGLPLDPSSLTTHGVQEPAAVASRLSAARLVFASGRSALEAAMHGAAVVVLGPKGLDGALTPKTWRDLARANFSGRRHGLALTTESLRGAILDSLQADVEETRAHLEAEFSLHRRAEELGELLSMLPGPTMSLGELELNSRLAQLLREQRLLAMQQGELEREWQASKAPWWTRLVSRPVR